MANPRKQHSGAFKTQVTVVALRGDCTISELSNEHGAHLTGDPPMEETGLGGAT